jgi:hypothetical protein
LGKTSKYESCQTYSLGNDGKECETGDVKYKLVGCVAGYHAIT